MATMNLEEFMTATEPPVESEQAPVKEEMNFEEFMGSTPQEAAPKPGYLERSFQSFTSGLAQFSSSLSQVPALAYGVAAMPQNALARATGWNVGAKPPEWMVDNPISRHFEKASEAYNYRSKAYPGETLDSLWKKKDYAAIGDYLTQAVIENTPNSLAAVGGSIVGIPEWQILAWMGTQQAAASYKEARSKNLDELEAATDAVLNGAFESVFERTPGLIKWGEELFKNVGKETGKAVIKKTLKYTIGSIANEGMEEFYTQLTQDLTNKVYGVEDIPLSDFLPRAIEAQVIGAMSGATTTVPGGIMAGVRASTDGGIDSGRAAAIQEKLKEYKASKEKAAEENVLRGTDEAKPVDPIDLMRKADEVSPPEQDLEQESVIEATNILKEKPELTDSSNVVYNDILRKLSDIEKPAGITEDQWEEHNDFAAKVWASRTVTEAVKRGISVEEMYSEMVPEIVSPPKQQATEKTLPDQAGSQNAYQAAQGAIYPAIEASSDPIISANPAFHTLRSDAEAVINHYATQRKVKATPEMAQSLFREMHDALGELMRAPSDKKAEVKAALEAKYPDMENEFMALHNMEYVNNDKVFAKTMLKDYGARRPKVGIEVENFRLNPDVAALQKGNKVESKPVKIDKNGIPKLPKKAIVAKVTTLDGEDPNNPNILYQNRVITEKGSNYEKKAIGQFGTTKDLAKSGFVLSNGKMLDFSKTGERPTIGRRFYDHTNIERVLGIPPEESGFEAIIKFLDETGSIRTSFNFRDLQAHSVGTPTESAIKSLADSVLEENPATIFMEISDKNGNTIRQKRVENPTDEDVKKFYSGTSYQGEGTASPRGSFTPEGRVIKIMQNADASTFMHESAHLWLQNIHDFIQSGKANEAYKADWETLSDWMGVKEGATELSTEQHEKFARGFELYLREGNAPSDALKRVFEKFKQWLTQVYVSARLLNVQITDEVRGVMDRMISIGGDSSAMRTEGLGAMKQSNPISSPEKKAIRQSTGQTRNSEKTISEYEALRESMRAQARAAKKSAQMTRGEIASAQTTLIEVLEKSGMDANDKAKFIRLVKNIQNQADLQKALPEIEQRIEGLIERSAKRRAAKAIQKELKKVKPKKQGGKPVGKFTPEIQQALNDIVEASHLTQEEAAQRIEANIANSQDGSISDELAAKNRILEMFSGIEDRSAQEVNDLLEQIRGLKAEGRTIRKLLDLDRRAQINDAVNVFIKEITGKEAPDAGAATFGLKDADQANPLRVGVRKLLRKTVLGWNDMLNIMSGKSPTLPGESFIEKFASVFDETQAEKGGVRVANESLRSMVEDAYGISGDKAVLDHLRKDTEPVNLGSFTNSAGVKGELVMTKNQARKKWMEMKDPSLQETFDSEKGMAYTPEIKKAIDNFLTKEDKQFAQAQLDFYQKYYKEINDVYKAMYGINLPKNPFYSPIKKTDIGDAKQGGFSEFVQEINVRRTAASSGSLKSRVKNIRPLDLTDDINVLQRHVVEMEHFKNWAEKVRDLQAIFGDAKVKQAIIENQGKDFYKSIFNFLEDFARGGVDRAKRFDAVDKIRIRTTQSSIALRPSILAKQLTSTFAYLDRMSTKEFISGVADFWKDPKGNIKILKESEFFRNRGENIDRDISDAVKSEAFKAFRKKDNFINRLMLNVKLGDEGAIAIGGWAVYKKALKDGKTHQEALREFSKISNETQQSGDLSEQSEFQRGGSFAKLFTMFQSAPNQYLRREIAAIRNAMNGRISKKEAAKTLAIYHVLLPMIFQLVSDFGKFKPEEQIRAAILGNVNGLFILGDMIEGIWRSASGLRPFGNELPIYGIAKDFERLGKFINEYIFDDVDEDDIVNAMKGLLGVVGFSTGLPARQAADMIESMSKIEEGEYREGIGGMLGWPQGALKEED